MQRNTIAELGKLRQGDRFTYLKRVDVWQVIDAKGTRVAVNQINAATGERIHKYDDFKSKSLQVRFLRHTMPLPHEECYINDLQPGDVFYEDSNIILEWKVIKHEYPKVHAACITTSVLQEMFPWNTVVTFVRKQTAEV